MQTTKNQRCFAIIAVLVIALVVAAPTVFSLKLVALCLLIVTVVNIATVQPRGNQ